MALPCVLKFDIQHRGSAAARHGGMACVCECVSAGCTRAARQLQPAGSPDSLSLSRRCRLFFFSNFHSSRNFKTKARDLQGQKAPFKNAKHSPQEFVPSRRRSSFLRFIQSRPRVHEKGVKMSDRLCISRRGWLLGDVGLLQPCRQASHLSPSHLSPSCISKNIHDKDIAGQAYTTADNG